MGWNVVRASARERLLAAASELFYADGMTPTGIDAITDKAGVAKMSLCNNFSSKQDLMLAYIEARHQEWLDLYQLRVENSASAVDRVLAVFEAYIDHAAMDYPAGFRGCGLLNAAAELPAEVAGREMVRSHKKQVEEILTGHLHDIVSAAKAHEIAGHLEWKCVAVLVQNWRPYLRSDLNNSRNCLGLGRWHERYLRRTPTLPTDPRNTHPMQL